MPIYEYSCKDCGRVFEEWQSGFDELQVPCPECGGESKRLISNTSFVLKGGGWYVTDYGNKRTSTSADDGNGNGNGNGTKKAEGDKAEGKKPDVEKAAKPESAKSEPAKAAKNNSSDSAVQAAGQ